MAARLLGLGYVVLKQRKKRRVGGPAGRDGGMTTKNLKVWFINLGFLTYTRGDLASCEVR